MRLQRLIVDGFHVDYQVEQFTDLEVNVGSFVCGRTCYDCLINTVESDNVPDHVLKEGRKVSH